MLQSPSVPLNGYQPLLHKRRPTLNSTMHLPVERALRRLGENISRARRSRQWTQKDLAARIDASLSTVTRMEAGDSGVAIQHIARALHVFGELDAFELLLDASRDTVGLVLMEEKLPQRVRARKNRPAAKTTEK